MQNRLAKEASPYLRSAAHQPVDWRPFGPEAFAEARAEGKPILLDIGAVWCHWCHVMDRESYEDPKTAALINSLFVPVKVDRDERPDVDARYQKAVQTLVGQGGWPLTAFLTPDGDVFYGGTYFPPRDAHGRPGFPRVLKSVQDFFVSEPEKVREQVQVIKQHLARHAPPPSAAGEIRDAAVQEVVQHALANLDPVNGGFGGAPKFPHTPAVDLLVRRAARTGSGALRNAVLSTLDGMRRGGIYDQLAGGFHRYSVDARWGVPHFEKMLYDNAGLLANYVHAYQVWRRPEDRAAALGIVRFLRDVLGQPGGGFGGSQDADVGLEDDGDYFTWTLDEAAAVLDEDELKVARLRFGIEERGDMHHNPAKNVLGEAAEIEAIAAGLDRAPADVADTLARAAEKLRAARAERPAPFVDPTVYASWNGMAAAALLEAGGAFADSEADRLGLAALDRLLRDGFDPARGFAHVAAADGPRGFGLLDDQAHVGWALCEAYGAAGEARYLEAAVATARVLESAFFDGATFRDRVADGAEVPLLAEPERPLTDSPTPAAIPSAARFLLRLSALAGDARYADLAGNVLRSFADAPHRYGLYAATAGLALDERLAPPPVVTLVGAPEEVAALRRAARAAYAPGLAIRTVQTEANVRAPAAIPCFGDRCLAPVADPQELRRTLEENR